jgi:TolB protein
VKGTVERSGDDLVVEARLFDVVDRTLRTGTRERSGDGDIRRIAHRFADEILLAITGERGPFDSKITFASRREGSFKEIYAMSLDGGDLRAVTSERSLRSPSWSRPHGRCSRRTAAATRVSTGSIRAPIVVASPTGEDSTSAGAGHRRVVRSR